MIIWGLPLLASALLWGLRVAIVLLRLAAIAAGTAIGCLLWLGWFIARPRQALAACRDV